VVDDSGHLLLGVRTPRPRDIRNALLGALHPSARAARISAIRRAGGTRLVFRPPAPGTLQVIWSSGSGRHSPRLATANATVASLAAVSVKVALTRQGRALLKPASHLRLRARATFALAHRAGTTTASVSIRLIR
jgi:hypothetical protein